MSAPEEVLDRLVGSPHDFVRWQAEVGSEEAGRQLKEACLAVMGCDGVRAVLPVVERMENMCARLEEFCS